MIHKENGVVLAILNYLCLFSNGQKAYIKYVCMEHYNELLITQYFLSFPLACVHGDIRLEGGVDALEGRVEVCHDGVWTTVCSSGWGNAEAAVACRQLNYSSSGYHY